MAIKLQNQKENGNVYGFKTKIRIKKHQIKDTFNLLSDA